MDDQRRTITPARIGDGSREFLFAWVFFGAGLFSAAAAAWGAELAGPFSSLCLVIGFVFLAGGLCKRLAWQIERRLMDIEIAVKQSSAAPPSEPGPPPQP